MKVADQSGKAALFIEVAEFLMSDLNVKADVPWDSDVSTATFDSANLRDITRQLGWTMPISD